MYLAPQATFRPHQRWHWLILGWFIPALIALPWLAGPLWMTPSLRTMLDSLFSSPNGLYQDVFPLRYLFLVLVGLTIISIFFIAEQRKKWILMAFIGCLMTYLIHLVTPRVGLNIPLWYIVNDEIDAYRVQVRHIFSATIVGGLASYFLWRFEGLAKGAIPIVWLSQAITLIAWHSILLGAHPYSG